MQSIRQPTMAEPKDVTNCKQKKIDLDPDLDLTGFSDRLLCKKRIYHQMEMLMRDLQGTTLDHDHQMINDEEGNKTVNDGVDRKKLNDDADNINNNDGVDKKKLNNGVDNKKLNDGDDNKKLNDGVDNKKLNDGVDNKKLHNDTDDDRSVRALATRSHVGSTFIQSATSKAVASGDARALKRIVVYMNRKALGQHERESSLGSVLAEAVESRRPDMVRILVEGGAKADDWHGGRSHLSRAVRNESVDIMEILIQAGADVHAQIDNKSLLHVAASSCRADVITCFLDNGSHVDAKDSIQGNTALHMACTYCNYGAVRALIRHGAEINTTNSNGDTPLAKLLRHITKNQEDWYNSKKTDLARELIQTGFMIFPSSRDVTPSVKVKDNFKKTKCNPCQGRKAVSCPSFSSFNLSSSDLPSSSLSSPSSLSSSLSLSPVSRSGWSQRKSLDSWSAQMEKSFGSLGRFCDHKESGGDFLSFPSPSSSSSSSSSSLSSSSLSSLSSPSSVSLSSSSSSLANGHTIQPDVSSYSVTSYVQMSLPWWQEKESKMLRLYDKLVSEMRSDWSLQQHCRLRILRCLATRPLQEGVSKLCLPRMVQHYLLYGHLGYDVES